MCPQEINLGNMSSFGLAGSRTDGSGLNHVADGETLDGLVLGNAASAVGAAHGLDVAAAVLVATARKSISYRSPEFANRLNPGSHSPSSGNVLSSFCSNSRCMPCAHFWSSLRRCRMGYCFADVGGLVLLVRPLLDHFDGLFCWWSGNDH